MTGKKINIAGKKQKKKHSNFKGKKKMKETWYKQGLDFKCQACGKCCHGFPGYVWLGENDIKKISKYLNLSIERFLEKYTRKIYGRISLKELKAPSYECIFFLNNKCTIYPVRPFQCSSYPFWPQNLSSKEAWQQNIKAFCKGANVIKTIHHSQKEIDFILEKYKKELPF